MHRNLGHAARDWLKGSRGHLILIPACLLYGAIGVQADRSGDFEPRVSSAKAGQASGGPQTPDPVLTGGEESRLEPSAALSKDDTVRIGRKGLRIRSRGGAFKAEMHLRSQIRLSTPLASAPRRNGDFFRTSDRDLRFRRARFKARGEVFRPWIRFNTEYDLVGTRLLDANVTIQKWDWLQFRFGQWENGIRPGTGGFFGAAGVCRPVHREPTLHGRPPERYPSAGANDGRDLRGLAVLRRVSSAGMGVGSAKVAPAAWTTAMVRQCGLRATSGTS